MISEWIVVWFGNSKLWYDLIVWFGYILWESEYEF